ncbi:MAG: PAS domain S-box protein, partial [Deltaproteobacteria bacterium]
MPKKSTTEDRKKLRKDAEARFLRDPPAEASKPPSSEHLQELQIHQIELEMLNEELRRNHLELEEAHLRQVELYDFAPVGYVTVDDAGLIREANLTTASLLDVDRSELGGRPFSRFVDPSCGDGWRLVLAEARRSGKPLSCDLVLLRRDGTTFDGHLICQHRAPGHADPSLHLVLSDVTERKRAEERVQTYVDRSPAALFVVDERGRYVDCNPAALELLGTDLETLRSLTVADVVEESDRPAALEEFGTLTRTGGLDHDYKLVRRDGRRIWVTLRAVKLADDRFMAFCQDVTPRRAALEALRESEQWFRAIFDGATDGIVTTDPANAQLLSCNAAFTALTGYTEEEVRHLRFEDMHEPADRERVVQAFTAMAEGRTNFAPGIPIRRKDGSVFAADISSARVVLPDRAYLAGFFRDVTERKLAIDALRESEQRFRALVEGAADAYFVHDFQGRFREVNRRACDSLGYTREELLRMSVSDVDVNFDLPAGQREWLKIEPGKRHSLSSEQRRKDGTVFPVDISFACIDHRGERLYMGIVRDVTERTQAENDKAAAAAMLHRTGELARVGGWELDLATRFLRFSPEALSINEVGPGEGLSLEQALERIDPGYRPSFQAALRAAIDEGTPFDLEVPIMTAKGRRIWSRTQGTVVREEG